MKEHPRPTASARADAGLPDQRHGWSTFGGGPRGPPAHVTFV